MSFSVSDDGRHALINVAQQVRKIIVLHFAGEEGNILVLLNGWKGKIFLPHFSVGKGESSCYLSQWGRGNPLATFLNGEGRENLLATFLIGEGGILFLPFSMGREGRIFLLPFSVGKGNLRALFLSLCTGSLVEDGVRCRLF